jgi:hypothetical protein
LGLKSNICGVQIGSTCDHNVERKTMCKLVISLKYGLTRFAAGLGRKATAHQRTEFSATLRTLAG